MCSGGTAQLQRGQGHGTGRGRALGPRGGGRRRRTRRPAGEVEPAGRRTRNCVAGAEPLDGPSLTAARGWARELGIHLLAGSISERGERARRPQHLGPDRPRRRGPRRLPQDPHVRRRSRRRRLPRVRARAPGDEIVTAPVGDLDRRPHRLLRPPLPGAVPDPRRARRPSDRRAVRLHRWRPAATTGRCCCGRGRSRTRLFVIAPNQWARRRRTTAPTGARRSSTPGAWCSPPPPTGSASSPPISTSRRRSGSASAALARQPPPDAYLWPQPRRRSLMAQAPPADKRRQILDAAIRVFARQGFHATRVSDIADEAGSPTASSTTTSSPRTRSSTNCSSSAGRCCWRRSRRRTGPAQPARQARGGGRPSSSSPTATTRS